MPNRNLNYSNGGKRILGTPKTGVLGALIPASGDSGAGYCYNDLSLPADASSEIAGWITAFPSAGTLVANEDTSFTFSGAPDGYYTFSYQLRVNSVSIGQITTVSLLVGTGTHGYSAALVADSASIYATLSRSPAVLTLTAADINAIVAALIAAHIPVNVKEVNDVPVKGIGTTEDPWNPV